MAVSGTDLVEAAPLRSGAATSIALAISRESTLKWLTLGGIALIDAVWIAASDFHLVFAGAAGPIICALLFAAAAYFFRVVRRNPTLFILTDTLAQIIACFAVCGVLSYLVISTNQPLADSQLAALDRADVHDRLPAVALERDAGRRIVRHDHHIADPDHPHLGRAPLCQRLSVF